MWNTRSATSYHHRSIKVTTTHILQDDAQISGSRSPVNLQNELESNSIYWRTRPRITSYLTKGLQCDCRFFH